MNTFTSVLLATCTHSESCLFSSFAHLLIELLFLLVQNNFSIDAPWNSGCLWLVPHMTWMCSVTGPNLHLCAPLPSWLFFITWRELGRVNVTRLPSPSPPQDLIPQGDHSPSSSFPSHRALPTSLWDPPWPSNLFHCVSRVLSYRRIRHSWQSCGDLYIFFILHVYLCVYANICTSVEMNLSSSLCESSERTAFSWGLKPKDERRKQSTKQVRYRNIAKAD